VIPTVAHVNYSFFHSTQSFIFFYLSGFRRVCPICLTRAPESPSISSQVPPELDGDLYAYAGRARLGHRAAWRGGLALRRALSRTSPRLSGPLLAGLHRQAVPRLRADADAERFLDWAESILRQRQAAAIHAYYGPIGWRMLELRRRLDVPLVVSFLGDDMAPSLAPWWWWWVEDGSGPPDWPARLAELFAGADLVLAEGPSMRERLIELGCPPEKVEVQRMAIPVAEMPFRPRRPDGRPVLVFAGRFCAQKGLLYALEAARRLRDEGRDFELRLIGDDTLTDGSYASRVYAYVREHGLGERVRMLGFLDHARYLEEMQRGDLFVHPSVVDDAGHHEGGAPTTILEAQALGMPVVSTLHCDIPNVTRPGESALLVPERDSEALTRALTALLDDPSRWADMGRAGRSLVEERHSIDAEAARLEERYLALLGPVAPRS
jgi:colanic acid/amylovoran biosynthesis glycosyltransferase